MMQECARASMPKKLGGTNGEMRHVRERCSGDSRRVVFVRRAEKVITILINVALRTHRTPVCGRLLLSEALDISPDDSSTGPEVCRAVDQSENARLVELSGL